MSQPDVVVEFENKYGEKKVIHKTRNGLRVKYTNPSVALSLGRAIQPVISAKIKQNRIERGLTYNELGRLSGVAPVNGKQRMFAIENPPCRQNDGGVRLGTLYAIAIALDVPITDLLPTADEVRALAPDVRIRSYGRGLSVSSR